jgi:hypothetical protein
MRTVTFCIVMAAVLYSANPARAAITVQGTEQPPYTSITNQLGMSHGVVFNSTMGFVTFGENGINIWGIYGTEPTANPMANYAWYSSPIEVKFVDMFDGMTPTVVNGTVSAVFGDGGGDTDGIRMRAYDINNVLLDTQTALSVSLGNISITANGINRLVFDQSGLGDPTSDTFLDSLTYPDPVSTPEPAAGSLLMLAGLAVAAHRRPRVV